MHADTDNPLKARLSRGEPAYIFGVRTIRNAAIVGVAQAAGHDAVYVDFQHSPIDLEAAAGIFQAALHAGLTALARISQPEPALIGRLLDAGAHGLMVADVRSAEQARQVVQAALLAPAGDRSLGLPIDPRFRGFAGAALMKAINEATLLVAMIESPEGLARAGEIAATPGIDAVQVGSSDLSAALGIPGEYLHPRMLEAFHGIADGCRQAGKPFIVGGLRRPEHLAACLAMGAARCYFTGSDTAFVLEGARGALARAESADRAAGSRQTPEHSP